MADEERRGRSPHKRTPHTQDKRSVREIMKAIKGSAGIKNMIAERLRVTRATLDRYLRKFPMAAQSYADEVNTLGDDVENVLIEAIRNKDVETARWYAARKLKDRGYSERYEVVKDFKEMTNDELVSFIEARIGADGNRVAGSGAAADPASEEPTIH